MLNIISVKWRSRFLGKNRVVYILKLLLKDTRLSFVSSSVCFLYLTRNKNYVSFFLLKGKLFYGVKRKKPLWEEKKYEREREREGEGGGEREEKKEGQRKKRNEEKDHWEHFISLTRRETRRYVYLWQIMDVRGERNREETEKGVKRCAPGFICHFVFISLSTLFALILWHIIQCAYNNTPICAPHIRIITKTF